jgi:hypothetical protein
MHTGSPVMSYKALALFFDRNPDFLHKFALKSDEDKGWWTECLLCSSVLDLKWQPFLAITEARKHESQFHDWAFPNDSREMSFYFFGPDTAIRCDEYKFFTKDESLQKLIQDCQKLHLVSGFDDHRFCIKMWSRDYKDEKIKLCVVHVGNEL